jgi:hypothetical protein
MASLFPPSPLANLPLAIRHEIYDRFAEGIAVNQIQEGIAAKGRPVEPTILEQARLIWREEIDDWLNISEKAKRRGKLDASLPMATTQNLAMICYSLSEALEKRLAEALQLKDSAKLYKEIESIIAALNDLTIASGHICKTLLALQILQVETDKAANGGKKSGITKDFVDECRKLLRVMPRKKQEDTSAA